MELAPIVLFVYNRPWHTQQTIEALQKNDLAKDSILYIYSDGAKNQAAIENVLLVREYIKSISGFIQINIIEREKNWGLANNIIDGVTKVVNLHGKVIVLEDDIVTSSGFLLYMNEALKIYAHVNKVMHISSFIPEGTGQELLPKTFFLRFMSCWGWGTWKEKWSEAIWDSEYLYKSINNPKDLKSFNLDHSVRFENQLLDNIKGHINTWAIKWFTTIYIKDGLCLYPYKSLINNIGLDGSGIHCSNNDKAQTTTMLNSININRIQITESTIGRKYLMRYYKYGKNSTLYHRLIYMFDKITTKTSKLIYNKIRK